MSESKEISTASACKGTALAQGPTDVSAATDTDGGPALPSASSKDAGSMTPSTNGARPQWIFGFGSLIHNPGFPYSSRVNGYVKGYKRVFYQGSTDHRGVPGAPGRVVTLIHEPGSITWGAAFALAGTPDEQAERLKRTANQALRYAHLKLEKIMCYQYLEWREKQYDVRETVDVFGAADDVNPIVPGALVYIASEDSAKNENYLGPASMGELAAQIASARGPSGPNAEYLYRLVDALVQIGVHDAELMELEAAVRALQAAAAETKQAEALAAARSG